ncbi:MAG: ABC-2 family transporter protein [Verrucomicrobium sp.]|jgi:ABC-2 type transport system permease protein|nr:ABC-2 family transporter protein [Verrucomicrobium sp.]
MALRRSTLARYLGIHAALVRYSLIHEMQFKANFLLWIVVEALWFGLQLAFMSVIYGHTDRIAGWSRWEVVLLVGCNQFIQQLFHVLFVTNLSNLSELIRKGTLDLLLLQPVNTRFLISVKKFEIGNIVNALMGLAVVFYALARLGTTPSPAQWLGFAVVCVAGLSVHYSLMFLLACIAFWTVRAQGIVWGYYNLFNIARLPAEAFPRGAYRAVFTWVLPMLLVSNVPAKLLAQRLGSTSDWIALLGMAVACFVASELFWRFSLRHYTSASA